MHLVVRINSAGVGRGSYRSLRLFSPYQWCGRGAQENKNLFLLRALIATPAYPGKPHQKNLDDTQGTGREIPLGSSLHGDAVSTPVSNSRIDRSDACAPHAWCRRAGFGSPSPNFRFPPLRANRRPVARGGSDSKRAGNPTSFTRCRTL
jgi:hypothetical protein